MSQKIRFGTDGWRGVIAADYTFDNVRRAAQGYASFMLQQGRLGQQFVVGYDKRFQSENFAKAAAEVMAGNGLRVLLTDGPTPTPVIAYAVVHHNAGGAINITASHNPPTDNGFKVRNHDGGAIDPAGLKQIEALIPADSAQVKLTPFAQAQSSGAIQIFDPAPAYIEHLNALIDLQPLRAAGLNILVDSMWGNGAGWFPRLLNGGKTIVSEIHNTRNPVFPEMKRPEPIPPNIDVALRRTVDQGADILLVTDGDADRLGVGDEKGVFVNQLQTFALLAYYLLEIRQQRGPIVKTLSSTCMLDKLGRLYGVPVYETGVGFKYIAPKMLETDAMIGGEESGGYAFRGNVPERDGILAGLFMLDLLVKCEKKPSQMLQVLFSKVGAHYYDRIDTAFSGDRADREAQVRSANPAAIGGLKVTGLTATDGFRFDLEDGGWLLIRFSGTEPVLRVYCETTHGDRVKAILNDGLHIAGITS